MRASMLGAATGFGLCLLLVGCGSSSGSRTNTRPTDEPAESAGDEVDRKIATGANEILARDESRVTVWSARSKSSELEIRRSGALAGTLADVQGIIFQQGKEANRFRAREAEADQEKQSLTLRSNVQLQAVTSDHRLTAETVRWLAGPRLVEAQKNVVLSGGGFRVGPLPVAWALPDLKRFGSPESFRNDPNMKTLIAPLLASALVTQSGTFADDQNNMRLTFRQWNVQQTSANQIQFRVSGAPATGSWRSQGLQLGAQSIDGKANRGKTGGYVLQEADLKGNVRVTLLRKEVVEGTTLERSTVLTSNEASFRGDAQSGTLNLSGTLTVTSALPNQRQWMQLTGTGGSFDIDLTPGTARPVRSGEVRGPVTLRMISRRRNAAGQTEETDVTASGRSLRLAQNGQQILLTGDVRVSGKGAAILGQMQADKIEILLDDKGFVTQINAEGAPGTAQIRETP